MSVQRRLFPLLISTAGMFLASESPVHGQGGREFLAWLKEYSPTGYFIINDYETRAKKPGDHKQWELGETSPMPSVAVHESGHARNFLNHQGSRVSYYIGDFKDFAFTPDFEPFNSKEMMPDIPVDLVNFQTDVYISGKAGINNYSMTDGIIGILEEWDQYITGLTSGVEMSACYKAHFDTPKHWDALANDMTTSVWSNAEFRYFVLRYILWARKRHPDVYAKIIQGQPIRQCYTHHVNRAEKVLADWKAVLGARKMDTLTRNGFDWHWTFWNEIQKPEYKELEAVMLVKPVALAPAPRRRRNAGLPPLLPHGGVDLLGRSRPAYASPERAGAATVLSD